jgi:gamma-glutamylcyclotransferase (GGCT)/AIG2-like uncharacterized protein YtfP
MKLSTDYLFVYGTLLAPFGRPEYIDLQTHAQDMGEAHAQGILFNIEWYPGFVLSDSNIKTANPVLGRLWKAKSQPDLTQLIDRLDLYEGVDPSNPNDSQYRREVIQVSQNGKTFDACCYIYNWSTEDLTHIESGDFVAFSRQQYVG